MGLEGKEQMTDEERVGRPVMSWIDKNVAKIHQIKNWSWDP